MLIKIENHDENTTRIIDYPGTVNQFVQIHFLFFGFYKVVKTGRDKYEIYNKFDNVHCNTISKAKKGDIKNEIN